MIQDTHSFNKNTELAAKYANAEPEYTWGDKKFTLSGGWWTATGIGTIDGVTVTEIRIENTNTPRAKVKATGSRPNTTINFGFLLGGFMTASTPITVNLVNGWSSLVPVSGIQMDGVEGAIITLRETGVLTVTAE